MSIAPNQRSRRTFFQSNILDLLMAIINLAKNTTEKIMVKIPIKLHIMVINFSQILTGVFTLTTSLP